MGKGFSGLKLNQAWGKHEMQRKRKVKEDELPCARNQLRRRKQKQNIGNKGVVNHQGNL